MTDEIATLSKRMQEIAEKWVQWKESGIDEEILVSWMVDKTKMNKKQIREFLHRQEEFYNKLIKTAVVRNLKE